MNMRLSANLSFVKIFFLASLASVQEVLPSYRQPPPDYQDQYFDRQVLSNRLYHYFEQQVPPSPVSALQRWSAPCAALALLGVVVGRSSFFRQLLLVFKGLVWRLMLSFNYCVFVIVFWILVARSSFSVSCCGTQHSFK